MLVPADTRRHGRYRKQHGVECLLLRGDIQGVPTPGIVGRVFHKGGAPVTSGPTMLSAATWGYLEVLFDVRFPLLRFVAGTPAAAALVTAGALERLVRCTVAEVLATADGTFAFTEDTSLQGSGMLDSL